MAQTNQINLVPNEISLRCAIGASVAIRLSAYAPGGAPFILTPYDISAPFVSSNATSPPVGAWTLALEESAILMTLTETDTADLAPTGTISWHWNVWLDHKTEPQKILFCHGSLILVDP